MEDMNQEGLNKVSGLEEDLHWIEKFQLTDFPYIRDLTCRPIENCNRTTVRKNGSLAEGLSLVVN